MALDSMKDLLYFVSSLAIGWIAVFLCWALYELAKLLHQANTLVTDTRQKISRIEHAMTKIKERIESSAGYLSMIAEGGKALLSFLHTKEEKHERRRKKKGSEEDEE